MDSFILMNFEFNFELFKEKKEVHLFRVMG